MVPAAHSVRFRLLGPVRHIIRHLDALLQVRARSVAPGLCLCAILLAAVLIALSAPPVWPLLLLLVAALTLKVLAFREVKAERLVRRLKRLAERRGVALLDTSAELAQVSQAEQEAYAAGIAAQRSYRSIFENAIEGIFQTSLDGHYLAANPALAQLYGYDTPAQLIAGLTDIAGQLYVDPTRREAFRDLLKADDHVKSFVSEVQRRDGSTIWISENARAVRDEQGHLLYYEGTVEDITARHKAEEALRKALTESHEATRAKMAFLAAMSHELKTPLNAVIGFSDLMSRELLGPLGDERYKGYAADIHASGRRLLARIDDVLDLVRLEGGAVALHEEDHVLPDIIADAASAVMQPARAPVSIEVSETLPLLRADGRRLRQIFVNLIDNAIKFTEPQGTVAISASEADGGGLAITVRDTGIGMVPEQIEIALEPFKQLDSSLARRFDGIGLGLPIARALVTLHDGTMAIESALGIGTSVTLNFPPARVVAAR